ncbi:MAG: HAD-IA family hydrolase [Acidimicrobiia bacterium]|nr:HAD-IA family hydrolase [Acidimicrobiia bacterium]
MKAAGLLLDLDRTLVDVQSYTDYDAAVAGLPKKVRSARVETPETEWDSATRHAMDILVAWAGTDRWQEISDHIELFESEAVVQSRRMPGVFDFLDAVSGLPIVVVTLMGPRAARAALVRHGIDLPIVLGRESTYQPKPAPDQLLAGCARMDLDPAEVVMIGDSSWDAAAAAAAGCGFVGLTLGKPCEFSPSTTVVEWLMDASRHVT